MTEREHDTVTQTAGQRQACFAVEAVLGTEGQALDSDTRSAMQASLRYDFSRVRIHTDARSAAAAQSLQAHAFTFGEHIAMAPGAYQPNDRWSRALLRHELTHVMQQSSAPMAISGVVSAEPEPALESAAQVMAGSATGPATLPRARTRRIQLAGFIQSIRRFFGGGTFSTAELVAYLATLRRTQRIEDDYDSDNKARDVVRRARAGEAQFSGLTETIRVLLIRELLSGYVSGADEDAILGLLTEAPFPEAHRMITTIGEYVLLGAFSGANQRRLKELTERAEIAPSREGRWSVRRIKAIFRHEGREQVLTDLATRGWSVWSFQTAFDTWEYPDGRQEEEEVIGLRGNTNRDEKRIRVSERLEDEEAASTLLHESVHALGGPPTSADPAVRKVQGLQQEVDARVATEQHHIRRGLPPSRPGYRKADGTVDVAFIRAEIFASPHYNPTTRQRVGVRRWVGDRVVPGVLPAVAP